MRISDWSSDVCSSDLALRTDFVEMLWQQAGVDTLEHLDFLFWAFQLGNDVLAIVAFNEGTQRYGGILLGGDGAAALPRSEKSRVGKECGSKCRSRWSRYH